MRITIHPQFVINRRANPKKIVGSLSDRYKNAFNRFGWANCSKYPGASFTTLMNLPVSNQFVDIGGLVLAIIIALGLLVKIRQGVLHRFFFMNMFASMKSSFGKSGDKKDSRSSGLFQSIVSVFFLDVLTARPLQTCNKTKRVSHIFVFWGFVFTGISTILAYLMNPNDLILPLSHPVKIFGNAGGVLLVAGFLGMFYIRYQENGSTWSLTKADYFLVTLFLTVITGFITQQMVYSFNTDLTVDVAFWIHMVFIVLLLATAPFTKFGHAVYKPVWLLYDQLNAKTEERLLPEHGEVSDVKSE